MGPLLTKAVLESWALTHAEGPVEDVGATCAAHAYQTPEGQWRVVVGYRGTAECRATFAVVDGDNGFPVLVKADHAGLCHECGLELGAGAEYVDNRFSFEHGSVRGVAGSVELDGCSTCASCVREVA